ncbi:decarboxylase [Candidatus Woesearchaeota archaeon CG_4_10_14_0_2_um_filter_33_13]|nr:MAG: decarboxylase [Candidatus Woesearchaeota archaeon CG_4_10_14_0_2_um_filter_33_13]
MNKVKFVLSKSKVLEQYQQIVPLTDFISYSSKTNQVVTTILEKETDCFFSVHFFNELEHIKDCSRVLFLAQAWNDVEIKELVRLGINNFVVDNESDLDTLLDYLTNTNLKVNLQLRMKIRENSLRTERYFVFGMSAEVINKRVKELSQNKNIAKLGIHFHRKTQNMSEWNYIHELSCNLEEETLQHISILNMGGGLPSEYANTNVEVLQGIFSKITEFRNWLSQYNIKLMLEPGRFIAAPAGKLITQIIGIHENNIVVNASVYNTDMDALVVPVKLLVEGELTKEDSDSRPYVIKGITPCSMDLFRYRVYLKEPKVSDTLIFLNAGAYNFSTNFCDLEELETEVVE